MADEKKQGATVDPQDATKHGWWGTSPVHKEVQGPLAEEAAQGGARSEGTGEVDKSAREKQAVRRPSASKEENK